MFYKSGKTPQKEEPIIPPKGGCKPGWWAYGGYCYKDFGFSPGFDTDKHMTYQLGNNSCVAGSGLDIFLKSSGDIPGMFVH